MLKDTAHEDRRSSGGQSLISPGTESLSNHCSRYSQVPKRFSVRVKRPAPTRTKVLRAKRIDTSPVQVAKPNHFNKAKPPVSDHPSINESTLSKVVPTTLNLGSAMSVKSALRLRPRQPKISQYNLSTMDTTTNTIPLFQRCSADPKNLLTRKTRVWWTTVVSSGSSPCEAFCWFLTTSSFKVSSLIPSFPLKQASAEGKTPFIITPTASRLSVCITPVQRDRAATSQRRAMNTSSIGCAMC